MKRVLTRVGLVAAMIASLLVVWVPAASATAVGTYTTYSGGSPAIGSATSIVTGPDGALWFTNYSSGANAAIERITTTGSVTKYTDSSIVFPYDITVGPDGALWFTNNGSPSSIGRITTDGDVSSFTGTGILNPTGITAGPDGALWFTNQGNNSIGRITTAGVVSNYADPNISFPDAITAGPDGALWFTNFNTPSIGRITTSGAMTFFTDSGVVQPIGITAGPDGALWFANNGGPNGGIGRITTAGSITLYTDPAIFFPLDVTAGPDGALWFTDHNYQIGRMTTLGSVHMSYSSASNAPFGLTAGPDSAVWVANVGGVVQRVEAMSVTTANLSDAMAGTTYGRGLDAAGGDGPYAWSLASGSLPPGLSLSSTGGISGVPREAGTFDFTVRATDSGMGDAMHAESITVNPGFPPGFLGSPTLNSGRYHVPYARQLVAAGGVAPYAYFYAPPLPPGLSLSASGLLSGTPTTIGTFTFNVTIFDDGIPSDSASRTFSLSIAPPTNLTILTSAVPAATHGVGYLRTLSAAGGTSPYKWKKVSLPKGLKLSKAGVLSGKPKTAGTTSVKVSVSDAAKPKHTVAKTFSLTIH